MDGFERRRERKKENIRQAAFKLFSAHGVQKVSIAEIAKKAGVSQVTIYNYFGSKDELLRDVITAFLDEKLQEYIELMESKLSFPEKIEQFIFDKTKSLGMLNPDFLISMVSNEPGIQRIIEDFASNKLIPLLIKFIEKGKSQGHINQNISTEAILIYISAFKAVKTPELMSDQDRNLRLFEELATLFYYGLMGKREFI
ncbi:transcriptional regulator [Desulfocucumis palustris]|uniref:Transcriptional regulator n=1 Tax=Desulfocucumis palustris TaxID=1898651 RepID=A0A2L2XEZ2_9FIRM|nr:TetR/AcrR family transcriptional regulator [Desulfocucumis palustris]GBF32806.1 transcriptional regulator [Desulfocucumis palustris]